MQNSKTFWDQAAKKYAKSPIQDMPAYEYTLGRIRSYLKESDRVLEIGCGTGSTALLLAPGVAHVTASDISSAMIAIAEQKAEQDGTSNIEFKTADIFDDSKLHGSFDAVLALNLLHLVEDTAGALERINHLLKPGGHFISKTVCKPSKGAPLKYRLMLPLIPLMQWFGKAPYVKFLTPEKFEGMIEAAGFRIVESGNHPSPSRFIVAQKQQ